MVELRDDLADEEFLFSDSKYVFKTLGTHVSEGYGTLFGACQCVTIFLLPRTTSWQKLIPIGSMLHWLNFRFGKKYIV